MLCRISPKNQITLPRELLREFQGRDYVDARLEDGRIILEPMIVRPVETRQLAEIRDRVRDAGLEESAVPALVEEARRAGRP